MGQCNEFRARLGAAIEGRLVGAPIAWHEHLGACIACRELLATEEALDELLACLPKPQLPLALAQRVMRRLKRDQGLDLALDAALANGDAQPADLAARILAKVQSENALDVLLSKLPTPDAISGMAGRILDRVDIEQCAGPRSLDELLETQAVPTVPTGLSDRVLAGLANRIAMPILRPAFGGWRRGVTAAVVVAAATLAWQRFGGNPRSPGSRESVEMAEASSRLAVETDVALIDGAVGERGLAAMPDVDRPIGASVSKGAAPKELAPISTPDPELLASLDLLEDWELLVLTDIDLLLGSLDESDAELLLLATSTQEDLEKSEQSEG